MFKQCDSDCEKVTPFFDYAILESYISFLGLSMSVLFLSMTLVIYLFTPQLLNSHGKNVVCLVTSLLLASVMFLLSSSAESVSLVCKMIAFLLHYFYLSSFTWMNIIAFDFCMTFSHRFLSVTRNRNTKRFLWYSLYAWGTPLMIVLVSFLFDFSDLVSEFSSMKPGYGNGICWITSSTALLLFFAGPLCLFKLFDFAAFSLTIVYIYQARRQGLHASKKNDTCTCIVYLKLSLIMGLTWIFAFVANISKIMPIWYLFIVFNSLQGMFISICFLCSKKVFGQLKEKFKRVSTTFTNSAT
jgi:hypothetical protein